jgi:hypothetical protein
VSLPLTLLFDHPSVGVANQGLGRIFWVLSQFTSPF